MNTSVFSSCWTERSICLSASNISYSLLSSLFSFECAFEELELLRTDSFGSGVLRVIEDGTIPGVVCGGHYTVFYPQQPDREMDLVNSLKSKISERLIRKIELVVNSNLDIRDFLQRGIIPSKLLGPSNYDNRKNFRRKVSLKIPFAFCLFVSKHR